MLVLTRKKGEAIHLGSEIEVRVLSVQGNRVRLGIEAPSHIEVRRGELVVELTADGQFHQLEDDAEDSRAGAGELALAH